MATGIAVRFECTCSRLRRFQPFPMAGATIIGGHVRLTMAGSIAQCHHERYDGSGYPNGLSGAQIPIEARILNLADQYDALCNSRCYKPAFDHETSFHIISEGDGRTVPQHFAPRFFKPFGTWRGNLPRSTRLADCVRMFFE